MLGCLVSQQKKYEIKFHHSPLEMPFCGLLSREPAERRDGAGDEVIVVDSRLESRLDSMLTSSPSSGASRPMPAPPADPTTTQMGAELRARRPSSSSIGTLVVI